MFDINYDTKCHGSKPLFNPLHIPFNRHDLCISEHEYQAIFDHDLGSDCLPGNDSNAQVNHDPEIVRVSDPHQCGAGTSFDNDTCTCFEDHTCDVFCATEFPSAPFRNPLEPCECIPFSAWLSLYNHSWGTHCVDPHADDSDDDQNDNDEEEEHEDDNNDNEEHENDNNDEEEH